MQCLQPQLNPLEKLYITAIQKRLKNLSIIKYQTHCRASPCDPFYGRFDEELL
jgi:hypothetical protein